MLGRFHLSSFRVGERMKENHSVKHDSEQTCVLYDPRDGRIVHTHRVVTLPGGRKVTNEEVEARTKEIAKQTGHDISGLHAMHFAANAYDASAVYRVDVTTKKLVKLEPSEWPTTP